MGVVLGSLCSGLWVGITGDLGISCSGYAGISWEFGMLCLEVDDFWIIVKIELDSFSYIGCSDVGWDIKESKMLESLSNEWCR